MAAYASNYFRELILSWFRGTTMTEPGSLWLALHTSDPGVDGSGAEVSTSGTAYARVEITANTTNWGAPSGAGDTESITNLLDIAFSAPSGGDWGVITHWALWTLATGGELVVAGDFTTPREVLDGDIAPVFPASQLTITAA